MRKKYRRKIPARSELRSKISQKGNSEHQQSLKIQHPTSARRLINSLYKRIASKISSESPFHTYVRREDAFIGIERRSARNYLYSPQKSFT